VAILLKLRLPSRNRVAILHADGLGMVLGDELKKAGTPVVFLDNDPKRCHEAQALGHNVVFGNALEERTLARAQFELVGTAIGLSGNEHLNSLFVSHAREYFRVPKSLVALEAAPPGGVPAHLAKIGADVLFDGPHDAERWDVRRRHNQIRVEYFLYEPATPQTATEVPTKEEGEAPSKKTSAPQERYVILTVRRADKVVPMTSAFRLRKGDLAAVALFEPEQEAARRELTERGWKPGEAPAVKAPASAPNQPDAGPAAQPGGA
jgi:Trk K+ transport system NAD-binding subunit